MIALTLCDVRKGEALAAIVITRRQLGIAANLLGGVCPDCWGNTPATIVDRIRALQAEAEQIGLLLGNRPSRS